MFRLGNVCPMRNTCAAHMKTKFCHPPFICAPRVGASLPFRRAGVYLEITLMYAAGPTEGKVFICQRVRFLWPVYTIVRANYLHMLFYGISKKPYEDTRWCLEFGEDMYWNLFTRSKGTEHQDKFSQLFPSFKSCLRHRKTIESITFFKLH